MISQKQTNKRMKHFVKLTTVFIVFISLFSCSEEDIVLAPLAEDYIPTFEANVDGTAFVADSTLIYAYTTEIEYDFNDEDNNVTEEGTYDAIRILGTPTASMASIALVMPQNAVEGTYYFSNTEGYYLANYLVGTGIESETNRAQTGSVTITLHNQEAHFVQGYFYFETEENSVTEGVFKTYYTINQ